MERAYDEAKYGEFSRRPYIDMVIPTPHRSVRGAAGQAHHVVLRAVRAVPACAKATWDEKREAFGDAVVDTIAEYAPNIKELILHRQVLTPLDLEREFGLTEGNIFQGELTLEQLFFLRPVPGWAQLPDADPQPLHVRIGHASRRRHHGRARPQRRARDAQGLEARERSLEGRRRRHRRRATTASSPRPCSRAAGSSRSCSSGATSLGGAAVTEEFLPGSGLHRRARAGPLRASVVERPRPQNRGLGFVEAEPRVFAPMPDGGAGRPVGRRGQDRVRAAQALAAGRGPLPRVPPLALRHRRRISARLLTLTPPRHRPAAEGPDPALARARHGLPRPRPRGRPATAALGPDGGRGLRVRVVRRPSVHARDRLRPRHLRDLRRTLVGGHHREPAAAGRRRRRQRGAAAPCSSWAAWERWRERSPPPPASTARRSGRARTSSASRSRTGA